MHPRLYIANVLGSDFYDTVENWFWYMMILSIGAWVLINVFTLALVIDALQALGMG